MISRQVVVAASFALLAERSIWRTRHESTGPT